jgi:hypothetical protein
MMPTMTKMSRRALCLRLLLVDLAFLLCFELCTYRWVQISNEEADNL